MLTPGDIIHYKKFSFENGNIRNKFFIILHKKPCLALITTSNSLRYPMVDYLGCHAPKLTFFLPAKHHTVFSKPTYLVMTKIWEFDAQKVKELMKKSVITKRTPLSPRLLIDIKNCLKNFHEDIPTEYWNNIFTDKTPSKSALNDLANKFNHR